MIAWGHERARVGPWRGQGSTALLVPAPDGPPLSAAFVRRCVDQLSNRGYRRVVTGALSRGEQSGFRAAGFEIEEELHLLTHDLRNLPTTRPATLRRARPADTAAVLDVDHASFDDFWQLDAHGLRDALQATPRRRYRVLDGSEEDRPGTPLGYAITGRAARRGYVQRLAVAPELRGHGFGAALVVDGLRWLRRWRVERAVVNTQLDNTQALALYERLGFRREPSGLSVLALDVGP